MKKLTSNALYNIDINKNGTEYFQTHEILLKELIVLFSKDSVNKIVTYESNRGGMPLNSKHYNKIAEEFNVSALGYFPIALNPETNTYHQFDGHNRRKAIMNRFSSGLMTKKELGTPVILRIYNWANRLKIYSNINNAAVHTGSNKWNNPDEASGAFLLKMQKLTGFKIQLKWAPSLGNVALALNDGYENSSYSYVQQNGQREKTKFLNCLSGNLPFPKLKGEKLQKLILGMKRTHEIYKHLEEEISKDFSKLPKEAMKLANSSVLFGVILLDTIKKTPQFTNKETNKIVCNILKGGGKDIYDVLRAGNFKNLDSLSIMLRYSPHIKAKRVDLGFGYDETIKNAEADGT